MKNWTAIVLVVLLICLTILAREYLRHDLELRKVTTTTHKTEAHEGFLTFPEETDVTTVEYRGTP